MPDPRFFKSAPAMSLGDILSLVENLVPDAELSCSDDNKKIASVSSLDDDDLSAKAVFCEAKRAVGLLSAKTFRLCFTLPEYADELAGQGSIIRTGHPKLCFAALADRLHQPKDYTKLKPVAQIDPAAKIHPSAVIGDGAEIGAEVVIGPLSSVGPGVVIGEGTTIGSNVSISFAKIGRNVSILSGASIGEAGFGFVTGPEGPFRLPQLGRVIIGDGAEIGANTTIDRGTLGDTIIGELSKIDNLIQIGHNVRIGKRVIMAAQSGVSGSVTIGDDVVIGGQVGISEGITVNKGAKIAAQSGVMRDIPSEEFWGGSPAQLSRDWLRGVAIMSQLIKKRSDPS